MRRAITMLAVIQVFALVGGARAVVVTTSGSSVIRFYDGFEAAHAVAGPTPAYDFDADPDATIGSWTVDEDHFRRVQVTDSITDPDPGPAQGLNYLRLDRPGAPYDARANAVFAQQVGGSLRASWMMHIDDFSGGGQPYIKLLGGGTSGEQRVRMSLPASGGMVDVQAEPNGGSMASTGLSFALDEWVRLDLDVNLDAGNYTISLSGGSGTNGASAPIGFYQAGNTADVLHYYASPPGNRYYVDSTMAKPDGLDVLTGGADSFAVDDDNHLRYLGDDIGHAVANDAGADSWANYVVEADVSMLNPLDVVGLTARVQDENSFYHARLSGNNKLQVYKFDNAAATLLGEDTVAGGSEFVGGQWWNLSMSVIHDKITAMLYDETGALVASVSAIDPTFTGGTAGVRGRGPHLGVFAMWNEFDVTIVPEPSTLVLLALGSVAMCLLQGRKRRRPVA